VEIAKRYWADVVRSGGDQLDYETLEEACMAAYAAGLARGRALGARDAIELVRAAGQLGEMDMGYAEILIAGIARRAGRGT
jgi:hypothetical protein